MRSEMKILYHTEPKIYSQFNLKIIQTNHCILYIYSSANKHAIDPKFWLRYIFACSMQNIENISNF